MRLETKRLILRTPKLKDADDIVEGIGEYDVSKMLLVVPYPYKKKDAIEYIKKVSGRLNKKTEYIFYIELKSEKKVIGNISLGKINRLDNTATTGSWINKKYWKRGFVTEAKIAVIDFAFNKLKLEKLRTEVYKDNKASNATQKKLGYKVEGFQLKSRTSLASKKTHDVIFYGLTKNNWVKSKAKLLKEIDSK